MECPFCKIIQDDQHNQIFWRRHGCILIEPLEPVTEGHRLVIPEVHVQDATSVPDVTAMAVLTASYVAKTIGDCNIITSVGEAATQSILHLHIHIIPRHKDDGLKLPWTDQTLSSPHVT